MFLFRHVLGQELTGVNAVRAHDNPRIPVVLIFDEVEAILNELKPFYRSMIELAWGAGLRKMEILRLRIKDMDFDRRCIVARQGKGRKDRITVMPDRCVDKLTKLVARVERLHYLDVDEGFPPRRNALCARS